MIRASISNLALYRSVRSSLLAAALLCCLAASPGYAMEVRIAGDQLILSGGVVAGIACRNL